MIRNLHTKIEMSSFARSKDIMQDPLY